MDDSLQKPYFNFPTEPVMVKNFKERLIDAVKKGPVLIFVIPDGTDSNGKQRMETDYD